MPALLEPTPQPAAQEEMPAAMPITADAFVHLWEQGMLGTDSRLELLEGRILTMSPIGMAHSFHEQNLAAYLIGLLAGRSRFHFGRVLRLEPHSQLQPDIAFVRLGYSFSPDKHPEGRDADLVVEISDSSLKFDRGPKATTYARSGVAELWIVDVASLTIEVCTQPTENGYASGRVFKSAERFALSKFPDVSASVAELLG